MTGTVSVPGKTGRVTLKIAISTTTPGAVFLTGLAPALLGVLLAIEEVGQISPVLTVFLLGIPSLMNAAVASLNDYYDYVSGNDTPENVVSESDGPLAYHKVEDPKPILYFAIGLLIVAALMGIYVILVSGIIPAVIGAIGGVIAITYSGGKHASSYLPIGEPLAGFTLGGLVPLGVYAALTGHVNALVLYKAIPMMLIVSQFMLANNTCDIDRDSKVGRRTLPILIGRKKAEKLAHVLTVLWMLQLLHSVATWYYGGFPVLLIFLVLCRKGLVNIFRIARTHELKTPGTAALAQVTLGVSLGYLAAVGIHLLLV